MSDLIDLIDLIQSSRLHPASRESGSAVASAHGRRVGPSVRTVPVFIAFSCRVCLL